LINFEHSLREVLQKTVLMTQYYLTIAKRGIKSRQLLSRYLTITFTIAMLS